LINFDNKNKSNKSINNINANFEKELEIMHKENQNSDRIGLFPSLKRINFENSSVQNNLIKNNIKMYYKKKSKFEISNYLENNDIKYKQKIHFLQEKS